MEITHIEARPNCTLSVTAKDGRKGEFDLNPYLVFPVFKPLENAEEFRRFVNGGYFVEWACGADLSADTIEAQWRINP